MSSGGWQPAVGRAWRSVTSSRVVGLHRAADDQHDRGRNDDQQRPERGCARVQLVACDRRSSPPCGVGIVGVVICRHRGPARAQRAAVCETRPDPIAELGGRGRRIRGARDRPRRGHQHRRRGAREGRRRARPACRPGPRRPGTRKIELGISSRRRAMGARLGRADHRAHAAERPIRPPGGGALRDQPARCSCSGPSGVARSRTSAAPGFEVRTSAKTPAPPPRRRRRAARARRRRSAG